MARSPESDKRITARYPQRLDLYHLFWAFVIVSFAGLVIETFVSYPLDGVWKDRAGFVWGPFSPIYGVGAVLFSIALFRLKDRPALLFVVAALMGGFFEWFVGRTMENLFGFVAWSYIDQPFCFDGYTSLGVALVWGVYGFAWMRWGLPAVWWLVDCVTAAAPAPMRVLTVVAVLLFVLDSVATVAAFECWFDRQSGVPVETPVQLLCEEHFSDEFMERRFQTISMYPVLAAR